MSLSVWAVITVCVCVCVCVSCHRRDNPPVSSSSSGSSSPLMPRTRSEENLRLPERPAVSGRGHRLRKQDWEHLTFLFMYSMVWLGQVCVCVLLLQYVHVRRCDRPTCGTGISVRDKCTLTQQDVALISLPCPVAILHTLHATAWGSPWL